MGENSAKGSKETPKEKREKKREKKRKLLSSQTLTGISITGKCNQNIIIP